jgi:hypothetical protein
MRGLRESEVEGLTPLVSDYRWFLQQNRAVGAEARADRPCRYWLQVQPPITTMLLATEKPRSA